MTKIKNRNLVLEMIKNGLSIREIANNLGVSDRIIQKISKENRENVLLNPIEFFGKTWITSQKFHEDVKPTSKVENTNRLIRNSETYEELLKENHILEMEYNSEVIRTDSVLESVFRVSKRKPVLFMDAVAQKALEHHFKKTAEQAVVSAKENAFLGLAGIDLASIAEDANLVMLLQAISKQKEHERKLKVHEEEIKEIKEKQKLLNGDTGYVTVLGYARTNAIPCPIARAIHIGKMCTRVCKEKGLPIGKVCDERHGKVNSYPRDIVKNVFNLMGK